jgi:RNA polymerase sigma factor (sigma-70 family)
MPAPADSSPPRRPGIILDGTRLRARERGEWDKAYVLARTFAHRYVDRLGGDVDDLVQEALTQLAAELDTLAAKGVPPAAALLRTFYCRFMRELRRHHQQRSVAERLPGEPAVSPVRPDEQVAEQQLADALDHALRAELTASAPLDRAILEGVVAGLSNRAIADAVDRVESTVCERLTAIVKRLRRRLRSFLKGEAGHD